MEVIYESDDYLVKAMTPPAPQVVVTYSYFVNVDTPPAAFADRLLQRLGFAGIYVIAKTPHWCQSTDRIAVTDAVRRVAEDYPLRVAFGASKGGYSALALGAAMGCQRIVAVSPQTVISNPNVPLRQEWAEAISRRPIFRDDVAADLCGIVPEIVFDPTASRDLKHVQYLQHRHKVRESRFPYASHKIMGTLKECKIMDEVTEIWLTKAADAPSVRHAFRANRHLSPMYFFRLGLASLRHGHTDTARRCADRIGELGQFSRRDKLLLLIEEKHKRIDDSLALNLAT